MSGQKKDVNRSRELFYNESRETAYNRQKDLRREIEIDVPELIDNDDYPTEQYTEERESIMNQNRSNGSVKIMNEFQMGSVASSLKKSLSNPKIRKSNQALSRTTTSIQGRRGAERKVEDLYKWQERIKKKHEMQREFQEQIKDSMYDYKVYTNDWSNQIMEAKRPNDKVENLLLERGKLKEMKLKALEKKLYGGDKVPSITERASKIHRNQNVYNRLYDLDKSRREVSREALSRNQSQVTELKSQRSKSETKVKYLHSALQSPARQYNNLDFFFSPTQKFSNKQKQPQQLGRENYTSPRNVTSPMSSIFSPIYKNNGESVKFKNSSIQQSIEKSRDEFGVLTGSPTGQRRVVDNSKAMPISIYRRLTPFNKIISGPQDEKQSEAPPHKASSETQIPYSMRNQVNYSNNTTNTEQDNNTQRQKLSPGPAQTERTPVLPNMMYFKNNERPQSLTPQNPREHHHQQKEKKERHEKPQNNQRDHVDIKGMEAFWEKILQDDQEGRGRKQNSQFEDHEYNDDYHASKYRLDFSERNKLWMDKKNKKIETQRKQKQQKELQNCTFKPQLYGQDKGAKNHQQMLYNNFLHRMEIQSSQVPVDSYGNSPSRIFKHGFSPMHTMGDLDLFGIISSDSSPKEFGKNSRYMEDNELQKKLYNIILDAKR